MRKLAVLLAFMMLASVLCPLAVFAEGTDGDTVTITFTLIDKYDEGFALGIDIENLEYLTTVERTFERGHTLSDEDIPKYGPTREGGVPHENYKDQPDWEPFDPHGYTVTEDMTFTMTPVPTGEYFVDFIGFNYRPLTRKSPLHKGDVIPLPEDLEDEWDYVFTGWSQGENGYLTVTGNMQVYAEYYKIGNMNCNKGVSGDIIDAADATILLRGLVNSENNPPYFDRLADVNQNGEADPADATLILRSCVGAED